MDRGWNIKAMQRLIVTSATYRQSSNVTPELLAKDPYNRLLARGPRFRVDAEIVRDIALAASGLLNREGRRTRAFIRPRPRSCSCRRPATGRRSGTKRTDADRYRRALYTFRFRSVPYPMLQTFDAPNGDSSCVRRARSNTPLQALTTLNEPLFVEAARALALRTLQRRRRNRCAAPDLRFPARAGPHALARRKPPNCCSCSTKEQARFCGDSRHNAARTRVACDSRAGGRMDRGLARAAESGRNDHQGIDDETHDRINTSSRRWFFEQCGVGLGAVALKSLLAESAQAAAPADPLAPKAAAVSRQSEERHLPLHGGRAQPSGTVRQQAAADEIRRHAAAAGAAEGLSRGVHQSELEAARARSSSSRSTASPARNCPNCCRISPTIVDDIAIVKSMVDGRVQSRARAAADEHRHHAVRPAQHGRVGHLRARQRIARPARVRGLQFRQEGAERRQFLLGQRLPADRLSGRAVPVGRRSGAVSFEPAGRR